MPTISPRLYEELRGAFLEVDPEILELVAQSLQRGALPWFLDEFADAIRAHAFTPALWEEITRANAESNDDVERDLRQGWAILAPDRVFPLDKPSS